MNEYDGICWMGWVIIFVYFAGACILFYFISGANAIFWIMGLIVFSIYAAIRGAQKNQRNVKPVQRKTSTFTDEDFIYCKVGEWVSR